MKFQEIKNQGISNLDILFEKGKYIAHSPKRGNQNPETLEEHIKLVEKYFLKLIELNGLETIIDNLISEIIYKFNSDIKLSHFIKLLFYNVIIYHDFGKINHLFQQKDGINNFNKKIKNRKHQEGSNHSSLSAYIYLVHHFLDSVDLNLDDENQTIVDFITTCFSFPIYKHHSSYLAKIDSNFAYSNDKISPLEDFLKEFSKTYSDEDIEIFHEMISNMEVTFKQISELKLKSDAFFPLFALLKLNYSLLTASDYLATSDYMNGLKLETETDFGLINDEMKARLIHNFDNSEKTPWNGELIQNRDKYLSKTLNELQHKSFDNLNYIRQKLGVEVLINIEKNKNEKVFYIEAPTGGGKTNMSMIAVRKLLEQHPEINKVFYVFPFTTLITQTAKAIKETFGLKDTDIAQIHSKSGFQEKKYENEMDAKYGKEKRNQIDNLFVNYPFALMTHIKFFDILKSNKKDTNYLLHRLANSVVIIDELQAYSPSEWDKIKYFIAQYAELFKIRFVIMSATLPKIDGIELSDYKPKKFIPLIENAKDFLQNPNFAQRVEIKTDLLSKNIELEKLADLVFEKSKIYAETRSDKYKGSIYTIIEFIFKKSASDFFEIARKKDKFFDEIFVLSGTILEPRRKYIIEYLKDDKNRKKKILLITTQVVEAGVDIDMDLGFKNQSIIDSDEQLAGRINRNVKKQNCELWLFNQKGVTPKSIYGTDLRYKITRTQFSPSEIKEILTQKDFKRLYNKVFTEIEKTNKSAHIKAFNEYRDNFKRFDFKGIHQEFKLIDSENASLFVPIDIKTICYKTIGKDSTTKIVYNFSENERNFIQKKSCFTEERKVSGEKIWETYVSLIENKEPDFSKRNLEMKILNGIMSKFVFSVFMKKLADLYDFIENPITSEENKFQQYFKLRKNSLKQIYSEKGGINEKYLEQKNKKRYDFI